MKSNLLFILFFISTQPILSDDIDSIIIHKNSLNYFYYISPTISTGTHVDGLGLNMLIGKRLIRYFDNFVLSPKAELNLIPITYKSYYGISGESTQLKISGSFGVDFGKFVEVRTKNWILRDVSDHSLKYHYSYYYSTDKTSQFYGSLEYLLNLKESSLRFIIGNDNFAFPGDYLFERVRFMFRNDKLAYLRPYSADKFRTAKAEIEYIKFKQHNLYGLGLSLNLWTGDTSPNFPKFTGYAEEYSNGILSFFFLYNYLKISFGYDSEDIRDFFQNNLHYASGLQGIPLVEREGRFYLQFSLLAPRSFY